jgi:hypothetical protein
MSNFNASMDYRGINVSGQSNLPNPFDEINVKTLNIVDNQNQPYYTMPQEPVIVDNSVAVFNIDGSSSLKPYTQYPTNPSCFGWYDCGSGTIPANTITIPNIIIPSFIQTGGIPQYNNPVSSSFSFNQSTGIITCNEAGIYLIQQSYDIDSSPSAVIAPWIIGLYNRTSGRYYKGGQFSNVPVGGSNYSQTTYDTFTSGTQLNIYGVNSDPVNSINFTKTFLTIFRIA